LLRKGFRQMRPDGRAPGIGQFDLFVCHCVCQ